MQVPPTLEGSPRDHRERLEDLLTLVNKFGLPHLMVTMTADETSGLRWKEIDDLDRILDYLRSTATFSEAPAEAPMVPLRKRAL